MTIAALERACAEAEAGGEGEILLVLPSFTADGTRVLLNAVTIDVTAARKFIAGYRNRKRGDTP